MIEKKCIFKIGHISDAHLGNRQYGLGTRREDFRKAFDQCIRRFIMEQVNVVIFCGDTFHNEKPDFVDLIVLKNALSELAKNKIDCLAITGNHDREGHTDFASWIDLFEEVSPLDPDWWSQGEQDYLVGPVLYTTEGKIVAIYGLNWDIDIESSIRNKILPSVVNSSADFKILAVHAGMGGILHPDDKGQISKSFIESISKSHWKVKKDDPAFDYIALGHIHKPYAHANAYNPGSIEACSTREWDYESRGIYVISLYDNGTKQVDKYYPTNRDTKKIKVAVSMNSSLEHILSQSFEKLEGLKPSSMIEVELFGNVADPISSTNISVLKTSIQNKFNPLYLRVKDSTYLTKNTHKTIDERTASTTLIPEVFEEVFGDNMDLALDLVTVLDEGKEVNQIIDMVEAKVANNESQAN